MKQHLRLSLVCALLVNTGAALANGACCGSTWGTSEGSDCAGHGTVLIPRSLGDRLDWQNHYFNYRFDEDCLYGNFAINYEYMRSFRGERMAEYFFGSSKLHFLGSQATATRTATDLLADNFGMATDTDAWISFCPRVQNHIVDFQLYIGLNELCDGLYFQINLPLVHTKWNLNDDCKCCSSTCNACTSVPCATLSTTPFPAGYMSSLTATTDAMPGTVAPNSTFFAALSGEKVGDMKQNWGYGKFFGCDCEETKLAALNFDLGYNFYECEDYHIGAYLRVVAPTGTEMDDCHAACIFKPAIGDDHWKLGGGLAAHARLYSCDDEAHVLDMYMQGYAVHMFSREQVRSFDLTNGPLSRYMLLKEFNTDGTYTGNMYNAIDYATRRVKVEVPVQGEGVIGFLYKNECGFSAGIGYNIYGKSRENICELCKCGCNTTIASKNLGIKGNSPLQVQLYQGDSLGNTVTAVNPVVTYKLSATQSAATAFNYADVDNEQAIGWVNTPALAGLSGYDSDLTTYTGSNPALTSSSTAIGINPAAPHALTNNTPAPVILTDADLNLCSARVPSQVTNRVYGHLDYEWADCDWSPMLRLGGEVELASCSDKGAINLWGVMIQGSVSF